MKTAAGILKPMGVSLAVIQTSEAKILGMRWGVKWKPVLAWMKTRGYYTVMDLIGTYGGDHAECMRRALNDFWEWAT